MAKKKQATQVAVVSDRADRNAMRDETVGLLEQALKSAKTAKNHTQWDGVARDVRAAYYRAARLRAK